MSRLRSKRKGVPRGGSGRLGAILVMAGLAFVLACDDGMGPDDVVHVVEVRPHQSVVQVGDTVVLTANPKGPDGKIRGDLPIQWTSRHADLTQVVGEGLTGRVVALRGGLAEISAGTHGKFGLALLEIRNPVPVVNGLMPDLAMAGGPGFTLVVTGAGFAVDAQILWGGQTRTTQQVSSTELRATIPAADIATAGSNIVTVVNPSPGGGASEERPFTIIPAGAAYVEMQPNAVTLVVGGTVTFVATARDVLGNDLGLPMTWSSTKEAVATVTQEGVVTGLAEGVTVVRATTEGGRVGAASVVVAASPVGLPAVTSLSPDSVDSNPNGLEITIYGAGFLSSSGGFLSGSGRPTEFVSSSELRIHLWPGDLSTSATRQITVFNPGTGGGMSNSVPLTIAPGVWSVRTDPGSAELWPGQELQATATAYDEQDRPLSGRQVAWRSLQPNIATVDQNGRIRAVGPGKTAIEAVIGQRMALLPVQVYGPFPYDLLYEGSHGGFSELWLLTLGPEAAPRRILPAGTFGADPAASPDGSRIAFVGLGTDGSRNIFVVNRDGSNLRQITNHEADDDQPAWSRDGARIAFRSLREGVSDIFVMNADGTGLRNVTRNKDRGSHGPVAAERPTWTPSGRIVFTFGYQLLNPLQYHLVSVKPDGSDWKALTDGTFREYEPEVSPNGQLIALRRVSESMGEWIDIIAADGSQLGWLNLPGPGHTPSWSPDGMWLTYSNLQGPGSSAIYMTQLNSAERRVIVPQGGRHPVWIPRN
jgi:uncharacterized protein YjdB